MNKKKGFSLVEAVIALSVVVIVSFAALSLVLSSTTTKANAVNKSKAQYFAYNALECFKASDDTTEFESNMLFAAGIEIKLDENGQCTYLSEENKFTATVTIDGNTFEITVLDKYDDEIISFDYTKGAYDEDTQE